MKGLAPGSLQCPLCQGNVYLVMEDIRQHDMTVWPVSEIQPVLMRAREDADLLEPVSWTYASRLTAVDAFRRIVSIILASPFSPKIRITSRVS